MNLLGNKVGEAAARSLRRAIGKRRGLRKLLLRGNKVSEKLLRSIEIRLLDNDDSSEEEDSFPEVDPDL